MRTLRFLALASMLVCACGLERGGLEVAEDGGSVPSSSSGSLTGSSSTSSGGSGSSSGSSSGSGGGSSGGVDASQPLGEGGIGCVASIPAGWTLVAYESSRAACPPSLGAAHDEYAGATIQSGACGCACGFTAQPSCTSGTLDTRFSSQTPSGPGPCASAGQALTVGGTGCISLGTGGSLQAGFSAQPLPLSGGSCQGTVAADTSKFVKNPVRYCDVPSTSSDAVCAGGAPAGFSACIVSVGAVACPSGPFTNRSIVEDDDVLVCPACDVCQVTGACTNAQLTVYGDGQCQTQVAQLAVDGQCVGVNGQYVGSARYSAQPQASCSAKASASPTINPGPQHTVCCR